MSIVARWSFDAGDSRDDSGNGKNGTDTNVSYGAPALRGQAAQFAGNVNGSPATKIAIPDLSLAGGDFSVEVWCFPSANSVNPWEMLFGKNYVSPLNSGCGLYFGSVVGASTQFGFGEYANLKTFQLNPSGGLSNWYQVGVSKIGTTLHTYINGTPISTFTGVSFPNFNPNIFGHDDSDPSGSADNFKGAIDSGTVWNRGLSDAEWATLYNGGAGRDFHDAAFPDGPGPLPPSTTPYGRMLRALFPPGRAFNLEVGGVISETCEALAVELQRVHDRGVDLINETDPRTAVETLPDWERVFGLPNVFVPEILPTIAERQVAVTAMYVWRGGQSYSFFANLVKACGYSLASIDLFAGTGLLRVGDRVGKRCYGKKYAYAFRLNINAPTGVALDHASTARIIAHVTHSHIVSICNFL
ncbi:MAG: DUF2313 domain-containing protein [Myxococcaceae bacterium]